MFRLTASTGATLRDEISAYSEVRCAPPASQADLDRSSRLLGTRFRRSLLNCYSRATGFKASWDWVSCVTSEQRGSLGKGPPSHAGKSRLIGGPLCCLLRSASDTAGELPLALSH
jgi:hypothetical protein